MILPKMKFFKKFELNFCAKTFCSMYYTESVTCFTSGEKKPENKILLSKFQYRKC